jgi:hypothetical protein
LHDEYAKDGLAAISVSLDEPDDKAANERVISFLRKVNATFTNVILDESQEFWQKKFDLQLGPPCVFVFNREGKWKQFKNMENYDEVKKYALKCLKAK